MTLHPLKQCSQALDCERSAGHRGGINTGHEIYWVSGILRLDINYNGIIEM